MTREETRRRAASASSIRPATAAVYAAAASKMTFPLLRRVRTPVKPRSATSERRSAMSTRFARPTLMPRSSATYLSGNWPPSSRWTRMASPNYGPFDRVPYWRQGLVWPYARRLPSAAGGRVRRNQTMTCACRRLSRSRVDEGGKRTSGIPVPIPLAHRAPGTGAGSTPGCRRASGSPGPPATCSGPFPLASGDAAAPAGGSSRPCA